MASTRKKLDDLTKVKGIGPSSAKKLRAKGIRTFDQLAELSLGEINDIIGRKVAKRNWKTQAKKLAAKSKKTDDLFDEIRASRNRKTKVKPGFASNPKVKKVSRPKHNKLSKQGIVSWQLGVERAEKVVAKVAPALFQKYPEITCICVGEKIINKEGTKIPSIRIHVKLKKRKLKKSERIPEMIDGIPTDIEKCQNGKFYLAARGGESFKRKNGSLGNGTIGIVVDITMKNSKHLGYVSAAHVVRGGEVFNEGDKIEMVQGTNLVGKTMSVPGFFREDTQGDLALILNAPNVSPTSQLKDLSGLHFRAPRDSDKEIVKYGRGNKIGRGKILSINSQGHSLQLDNNNTVSFAVNHILIEKISGTFEKGDSGAAIIARDDNAIIGFLRAITDSKKLILATRFDYLKAANLRPVKIVS